MDQNFDSVPIPVLGIDDGDLACLVARARDGEEAAITSIYRRFAERVYRFCLFRVGGPADAEDLTQLTFVRAIEALPRYEERGLPVAAWLFRIARNAVIDFERSRRDHARIDDSDRWASQPLAGDDFGAAIDRDELLRAIAGLTRDQQDVLAFRFFAGLTAPETGRLMGRNGASVRGLQARALASLRRMLDADREQGTSVGGDDTRTRHGPVLPRPIHVGIIGP